VASIARLMEVPAAGGVAPVEIKVATGAGGCYSSSLTSQQNARLPYWRA
jgi:hypothetical protein